jgi:hypothetical protein
MLQQHEDACAELSVSGIVGPPAGLGAHVLSPYTLPESPRCVAGAGHARGDVLREAEAGQRVLHAIEDELHGDHREE